MRAICICTNTNEDMKGSFYLATWLANCAMAFGRLTPNSEKKYCFRFHNNFYVIYQRKFGMLGPWKPNEKFRDNHIMISVSRIHRAVVHTIQRCGRRSGFDLLRNKFKNKFDCYSSWHYFRDISLSLSRFVFISCFCFLWKEIVSYRMSPRGSLLNCW